MYDPSRTTFYYSMLASGKGLQRYPTGYWSYGGSLTAAPGKLFDSAGRIPVHGGNPTYEFVRIDEGGSVTVIYSLSPSDGVPAPNKLLLARDRNLYGVGSQSNEESPPFFIYRLTPSGGYSKLLTFPSSLRSAYPVSLILASDGDFYGTFSNGGANDTGVIYRATLSGQWHVVASFPAKAPGSEMQNPDSLVEASDGALYGSTEHNAIFRYDLATQALTLAYQMNPHNLQGSCVPCNFIQAMDGKLYGTAAIGGPGGGAIFSLDFGLPKPKPSLAELVPPSGAVGQRVLLWGGHLLGATSVTFNGVPAAAFQVNSTQAVMATVPAGATSGPVTITTANGSVTSAQSFTIQ